MSLVKIKFLKNVGHYVEGQEIEIAQDQADALCAPRERYDGEKLVKWQAAATVEQLSKAQALTLEQGGFSLDEERKLGIHKPASDPNGPGPILPAGLQALEEQRNAVQETPSTDEASFSEQKSADEGKSAKASIELNQNNKRKR